jgi:hypothetical protein
MNSEHSQARSFQVRVEGSEKGRVYVVLPFDPESVWGPRPRYHVRGTIDGKGVRGALEKSGKGYFLPLGPAYRRSAGLKVGDPLTVVLMPEGPQSEALARDVAAALAAQPDAAQFFDGLATFYRKKYLRWIDATRRSPEVRAQRIAELVVLMKTGKKDRPG